METKTILSLLDFFKNLLIIFLIVFIATEFIRIYNHKNDPKPERVNTPLTKTELQAITHSDPMGQIASINW